MKIYNLTSDVLVGEQEREYVMLQLLHRKNIKRSKFEEMCREIIRTSETDLNIYQLAKELEHRYGFKNIRGSENVVVDLEMTKREVELEKTAGILRFYFLLNGEELLGIDVNTNIYKDPYEAVYETLEQSFEGVPALQELPGETAVIVPLMHQSTPIVAFPIVAVAPLNQVQDREFFKAKFIKLIKQLEEPVETQIDRALKETLDTHGLEDVERTYIYPAIVTKRLNDDDIPVFDVDLVDFNVDFRVSTIDDIMKVGHEKLKMMIEAIQERTESLPIPTAIDKILTDETQRVFPIAVRFGKLLDEE